MSEVYVAATLTNGQVAHVAIQTSGRFPGRPAGGWAKSEGAFEWTRADSDENIEYELARHAQLWALPTRETQGGNIVIMPGVSLVSWRRISPEEHALFEQDRPGEGSYYRSAIVDRGGVIQHDMAKARECRRERVRQKRSIILSRLDGDWMKATGQGNKQKADEVEAERQKWRDAPADPRIDAAQSVEELKLLKVE